MNFFFDSTFNVKEMQSFAQFNYSTTEGDSLFGALGYLPFTRENRKFQLDMESQMVQNSRTKIGFTFNKFSIKVNADFNQAQQNQVTLNGFPLKVKT